MESKPNQVQELSAEQLQMVSGGGLLEDILQAITDALRPSGDTAIPANNAFTGLRG